MLLELRSARVRLGGRDILRGMELALEPGGHLAVLGDSGSGKTTLLRLLAGELWPVQSPSRQCLQSDESYGDSPIFLRQSTVLVSAETAEAYRRAAPRVTALQAVLSGPGGGVYAYGRVREADITVARRVLESLDAGHLEDTDVEILSEGQLKLTLLARAIFARPRLLLLDEVGDGLDLRARALVHNSLQSLANGGTTLIVAAHRLDEIPPYVTRGVFLDDGRVSAPRPLEFPPALPAPETPQRPACGPELFGLENITLVRDGRPLLRDITWSVRQGEGWAVTGPNGAGKTTLLQLLLGEAYPLAQGGLRRFGRDAFAGGLSQWDVRRRVGYASEGLQAALDEDTPLLEIVAMGPIGNLGRFGRPEVGIPPRDLDQARELLNIFGMADRADTPLGRLSFGRRRLALLLRAVMGRRDALVLDEPFSGLDTQGRREYQRLVLDHWANGAALVLVSHRPEDLPSGMRRLRVEEGRVREEESAGVRGLY